MLKWGVLGGGVLLRWKWQEGRVEVEFYARCLVHSGCLPLTLLGSILN